jgi:hypothetical protein
MRKEVSLGGTRTWGGRPEVEEVIGGILLVVHR